MKCMEKEKKATPARTRSPIKSPTPLASIVTVYHKPVTKGKRKIGLLREVYDSEQHIKVLQLVDKLERAARLDSYQRLGEMVLWKTNSTIFYSTREPKPKPSMNIWHVQVCWMFIINVYNMYEHVYFKLGASVCARARFVCSTSKPQ